MTVRLLMAATVVADERLAEGIRVLRFRPRHRSAFPRSRGGDHVQVQLMDGTRRDYSLCGDPELPEYEVAIQREELGRGGSKRFHTEVQVGDEVFVSYPQPGMAIDPQAGRHVFVAAGIGVTAILGLLHELPRDALATVHYSVRERADAIFADRLRAHGVPVEVHISDEGSRLDVEALVAGCDASTTLYHCGPAPLMAAIDAAASRRGVPARSEAFAVVPTTGEKLGAPFRAVMLAAGKTVVVAEDESLLQAMLRENVPVEFSCEGGVCGSCVVEVRAGAIDHRDRCLSDEARAGGLMTACVSRAVDEEISVLL